MKNYYPLILFGLIFLLPTFWGRGQSASTLILKLKPEFRNAFENRESDLCHRLLSLGIAIPSRKFPLHRPVRDTETILGKSKVDLSLMYTVEVPAPLSSQFLLRQLSQHKEFSYVEYEMPDALPLAQPNDPAADSTSGNQRQVLKKIKAYEAWAISQGDTNVVIGILDTGIPVLHPDLASQVKINPLDPPNGVDDDGNGLIDDYRGWDFGSNDSDPTPDNTGASPGHGTSVASLAVAATNNALGVAGVAWKCKLLPLKIWKWNNGFSNFKGYEAIVYAADRGCKVINCSWGSARSGNQYEQDIINYATFNKNSIVVAAGGNTAGYLNTLPANYQNAFGVTMCDTTDQIFWASSYHFNLDITAPGVNVYGIQTTGSYGWVNGGSSMASPLAAGGIGLIRSKFPELTGLQAGELLRVNADDIFSVTGNAGYRNKAGRGRMNLVKALQKQQSISLRAADLQIRNRKGIQAMPGDTVVFLVRFENYLDSVSGFTYSASTSSPQIQILTNQVEQEGIGTLKSRMATIPIVAVVGPGVSPQEKVEVLITVSVGSQYVDTKGFVCYFNTNFLDLDANEVRITVTGNAMEGYIDLNNLIGSGIRYRNQQWSGDAGLLVGISPSKIPNSVYDTTGKDADFRVENPIRFQEYPGITQHAVNHFNDSASAGRQIGLRIKQSAYELTDDSLMGSVFFNYQVNNLNPDTLDSLCIAHYNDWEVENLNYNLARWDSVNRLGITISTYPRVRYAAVQLLSPGEPQFYAIDALPSAANGNINLFDGFSLAEKWKCMSSGIGRKAAGAPPLGNNVVQVTGVKLRDVKPGEIRKVTFAYLFADSLAELQAKAMANQHLFNRLNTSPSPTPDTLYLCRGDTLRPVISWPNEVNRFQVYTTLLSPTPVFQGTHFEPEIHADSTFFVAGIDSLLDGARVPLSFITKEKPAGTFVYQALPGDSVVAGSNLAFTASDTSSLLINRWSVNDTVRQQAGIEFSFSFDSAGIYTICLRQTESVSGCYRESCREIRAFLPVSNFHSLQNSALFLIPNPASSKVRLSLEENDFYPVNLSFTDAQGRTVFNTNVLADAKSVDLSSLPVGFYLARFQSPKGLSFQKFIRE